MESLARAFSKARRSRRDRRSPSAEGETPLSFQSATEGEFQSLKEALKGGTAQVGGSHFYAKPFQIDYPLFSLAVEAQRKKLGKKEHAAREVSPRARGDQRSARWMSGRFWESDAKPFKKDIAVKSPINYNLSQKGEAFRLLPKNYVSSTSPSRQISAALPPFFTSSIA